MSCWKGKFVCHQRLENKATNQKYPEFELTTITEQFNFNRQTTQDIWTWANIGQFFSTFY